jgi:hypothetical protein
MLIIMEFGKIIQEGKIGQGYKMEIKQLLNQPKIIAIVGDANSGKSNLLYNLITELRKDYKFNLYTYGLRYDLGENKIHSIEELELIKDSVIMLDEFSSLFDILDRKKRKLIEKSLRLIFHNNNILILVGLPENYVKFISSKCNMVIFFKSTITDFVNGSRIKNLCLNYKGYELGSSVLNLNKDECIIYDGNYEKIKVPYMKNYDNKKSNCAIIVQKRIQKRGK